MTLVLFVSLLFVFFGVTFIHGGTDSLSGFRSPTGTFLRPCVSGLRPNVSFVGNFPFDRRCVVSCSSLGLCTECFSGTSSGAVVLFRNCHSSTTRSFYNTLGFCCSGNFGVLLISREDRNGDRNGLVDCNIGRSHSITS